MTTKQKAEAFVDEYLPKFRALAVERHDIMPLKLDPLTAIEWLRLRDIIILAYLEGDRDGYITGHQSAADAVNQILGGHVEPA